MKNCKNEKKKNSEPTQGCIVLHMCGSLTQHMLSHMLVLGIENLMINTCEYDSISYTFFYHSIQFGAHTYHCLSSQSLQFFFFFYLQEFLNKIKKIQICTFFSVLYGNRRNKIRKVQCEKQIRTIPFVLCTLMYSQLDSGMAKLTYVCK